MEVQKVEDNTGIITIGIVLGGGTLLLLAAVPVETSCEQAEHVWDIIDTNLAFVTSRESNSETIETIIEGIILQLWKRARQPWCCNCKDSQTPPPCRPDKDTQISWHVFKQYRFCRS